MFKRLKKYIALPSLEEVGMGKEFGYGALASRSLTPFQKGETWEDYDELVKKDYPIRWFLNETIPNFFNPAIWAIGRAWYWAKCHTLRRHRHHLLDFRGVDPLDNYTHGYMDPCQVIYLGAWAALRLYIERDKPKDPATWCTPEELAQEHMLEQKFRRYDEPHALYRYWMVERAQEKAEVDRLYNLTKAARKDGEEAYSAACTPWLDQCRAREAREQEMFLRLAAIRDYLWT